MAVNSEHTIHVLLIEDNPGDAELVAEMLTSSQALPGYQSVFHLVHQPTLTSGMAWLSERDDAMMVSSPVDVVLLDLFLPDSDGLHTFVKFHTQFPQIPVVVLTSFVNEAMAIDAVRQGAQDYLIKREVTGPGVLVRAIRYAVERQRIEDTLRQHREHLEDLVEARTQELALANADLRQQIEERKRVEETLHRRNRELAWLNQVSQEFNATLDLDAVLLTVLQEVRHLLGVIDCSIWLVDPLTGELVCRQLANPQSDLVRGWRLQPGTGIVGWVAHHGESLIVSDTRRDTRHFKGVDNETGWELRSILSVPLAVRQTVIGVLQVVDPQVNRFTEEDLELLEPLVMTAAMAIDNAHLYEQTLQDAETKAQLLREVNHRVANNLTAIIGLMRTECRRAAPEQRDFIEETLERLVQRVKGLAKVHQMLSESGWSPVRLCDLIQQVILVALEALLPTQRVQLDVMSSPVTVSPRQANHLALVINELAMNTIKHALAERPTGQIVVRVIQEDEQTVLCEYRDNGPGYPESVLHLKNCKVGLYLVRRFVTMTLHGELLLSNVDGAVATMRFPTEERSTT